MLSMGGSTGRNGGLCRNAWALFSSSRIPFFLFSERAKRSPCPRHPKIPSKYLHAWKAFRTDQGALGQGNNGWGWTLQGCFIASFQLSRASPRASESFSASRTRRFGCAGWAGDGQGASDLCVLRQLTSFFFLFFLDSSEEWTFFWNSYTSKSHPERRVYQRIYQYVLSSKVMQIRKLDEIVPLIRRPYVPIFLMILGPARASGTEHPWPGCESGIVDGESYDGRAPPTN